MIKLIASDIDGTMVSHDRPDLNPEYFELIRALRKKGILFCAATGRQVYSLRHLFAPVRDDILYIAENGSVVIKDGEQLFCKAMSKEDSEELVRDTRKMPGCMCMYDTREMAYFEKGDEEFYDLMRGQYGFRCQLVDDLTQLKEPTIKYVVYRASDVEAVTEEWFNPKWRKRAQVACGGPFFMDVYGMNVNKGSALAELQSILGIKKEETIAIGDNINDLELLSQASYSIAIGNARDEVRQAARYIAPTRDQDGVLQVMKHLLSL